MSGGSFDYLYSKFIYDDGDQRLRPLASMIRECDTYGARALRAAPSYREAAAYLRTLYQFLEQSQAAVNVVGEHLAPLMKAVEWTTDCDWGEESIEQELAKLRGPSNDDDDDDGAPLVPVPTPPLKEDRAATVADMNKREALRRLAFGHGRKK